MPQVNLNFNVPSVSAPELRPKAIIFIILCFVLLIASILLCFGYAFGIVLGILGIVASIGAVVCIFKQEPRLLLVFIFIALAMSLLAIIQIFVLILRYASQSVPAYVGCLLWFIIGLPAAWLAYDGRGRTLSWNPAPPAPAAAP